MTKRFRQGVLATVAAVLPLAGVARADVTPQDVWSQWETYMASFGYQIDNPPVQDGNDLRLPDFSLAMPVPADPSTGGEGGIVRVTLGDVALIDQGDGTVLIQLPETSPIRITGESLGDENFTVNGTMTSQGYTTVASGNPGDITYTLEATEITMAIDEMTGGTGEAVTPGALTFSLFGAAGTSHIETASGPTVIEQAVTVARMTYAMDITDPNPEKAGHFKAEGGLMGLTSDLSGMVPATFDPLAIPQALVDGYAINGAMTFASGQSSVDFAEDGDAFRYTSASQGGEFGFGMSKDGLSYNVIARTVDFSVEGSQLPFPVASSMGAFGLALDLPVLKNEEPQDFSAKLTLTDVAIPDQVWMMIDAGNALPHDPITAEIETSGKARLFVDVFDEKATSDLAINGGKPGEVDYLALDSLLLKAGGATIAATGGFDLDNTAKSPFNPAMPAFSGKIDLRLTGVTGLLGKLGQMGLIPMPQVMMASGMIQQLGKPESGPDDVSALIEISKDSQLTVNGAPLPFQ